MDEVQIGQRVSPGRTVDAQCRERPDTDAAQSGSKSRRRRIWRVRPGASAIGALAIGVSPLAHSI